MEQGLMEHVVAHVAKKPIVYGTKYGLAEDHPDYVAVPEPSVVARTPETEEVF